MEPKVKDYIDNILNCFGATDGGGSFTRLTGRLRAIEEQANNGDPAAAQIIEVVACFSRLVGALGKVR